MKNISNELFEQAKEQLRLGDGQKAISLARSAARLVKDRFVKAMNLGGIMIDAGAQMNRADLVRKGINMLSEVSDSVPVAKRVRYYYNLGNGYANLAKYESGKGPGTRPSYSLAVSNLDECLRHSELPDARTNLANVLMAQHRFVEAIDEYETVLNENPTHHQAIANRGYALIKMYDWTPGHKALLVAALRDHETAISRSANEPVFCDSYKRVASFLKSRVRPFVSEQIPPTKYENWIWTNRLNLNPCPICRIDTPSVFDIYPLAGHLKSKRRSPPTRHVLDIINRLCQSYATARWLLYSGMENSPDKCRHQVFIPSGSETDYSLTTGLIMAACSGFYSVINQTSFAANGYFHLGLNPRNVTIAHIWARDQNCREFPISRSQIRRIMLTPVNPGLTALYGLAGSLEFGKGRYYPLRKLRNSIEHHLVVVAKKNTCNSYYKAVHRDSLIRDTISLGRLAKAAIWYFSAAVLCSERRRARKAIDKKNLIYQGR